MDVLERILRVGEYESAREDRENRVDHKGK